MRGLIKYFFILLSLNLLKVFWVFPIEKNKIVFMSYRGKSCSCSPKYLYLALQEKYANKLKYVWVYNSHPLDECVTLNTTQIKTNSLFFFYHLLTCNVFIGNGIAPSYLPFRKQQTVVGTWHGGGAYKKGGLDTSGSMSNKKIMKLIANHVTYALSSCKKFDYILETAFLVPPYKILKTGLPRNDLFLHTHRSSEIFCRTKKKLGLDPEKKIVLYAPTFRSNLKDIEHGFHAGNYGIPVIKIINALKQRFGGDWIFLFRSHYYLNDIFIEENVIDVSKYDDMQELLLISDVLINDYSSSMWDFGLTKKPCFIYANDIEEYSSERGFYITPSEWPFPIATTSKELINNITTFDDRNYQLNLKRHFEKLGSYETGTACKQVLNHLNLD